MRHENIGEEPTTILPHMMAIDWTKSNTLYWQKLAMPIFDPANAFCPELTLRIMDDLSRRHNCQAASCARRQHPREQCGEGLKHQRSRAVTFSIFVTTILPVWQLH